MPTPLGSVLIPAHNEAAVIVRCLDALFDGVGPGQLEVVVACNGCTDHTAELVRSTSYGVTIIELPQASKSRALRAGEQMLSVFPRLYLDADVVLSGQSALELLDRLRTGTALAARPPIAYDTYGASWAVRKYYAARERLPAVMGSLWGAGVYGLSERGRSRFGTHPDVVAEDLYVDAHFSENEIEIVSCPAVVVTTPRSTADLFRILRRTYRGNAEIAERGPGTVPATTTRGTARDVADLALKGPGPAVDALTYSTLAAGGRLMTLFGGHERWERDESSRTPEVPITPVTGLSGSTDSSTRGHAVVLLQVFVITLFVFPSDTVIKTIGAAGFVASLVAMLAFATWLASTILGVHNPLDHRHPTRAALVGLWLVSLVSYAIMHRTQQSGAVELAADRWMMQLAGMSGVALIAAECLTSVQAVKRVLRALVWGGAFCGVVAALQFWTRIDLAHDLRLIPGFSINFTNSDVVFRGALKRVTGTTIDPIELGVVAGMLLPLALYLVIYDNERTPWKRWLPMMCIAVAIPVSVSRSAIVSVAVAVGLFVVLLPSVRRVPFIAALPVAVAGVFVATPGLIGTLAHYFTLGTNDPSISHRTNNYSYVEALVRHAPWFGTGEGTYVPTVQHILDNQYLTTAIELGIVGLVALTFFFGLPIATALVARQRTADAGLRTLCGALAGSAAAALICSATFDSLSFPVFAYVEALIVGLCGACWLLVERSNDHFETSTDMFKTMVLVNNERG
ncbi:MAG TPA: O-antigen ligase family protein [Acidimicrobiales bacterium]|nr:O-antigen ligase family protein [Acidimicrobiales bacterium]